MKLLVTGSSGLIGSEVCCYFGQTGHEVHGVDNNQRAVFFGPQGDTRWNQARLERDLYATYTPRAAARQRDARHPLPPPRVPTSFRCPRQGVASAFSR